MINYDHGLIEMHPNVRQNDMYPFYWYFPVKGVHIKIKPLEVHFLAIYSIELKKPGKAPLKEQNMPPAFDSRWHVFISIQ